VRRQVRVITTNTYTTCRTQGKTGRMINQPATWMTTGASGKAHSSSGFFLISSKVDVIGAGCSQHHLFPQELGFEMLYLMRSGKKLGTAWPLLGRSFPICTLCRKASMIIIFTSILHLELCMSLPKGHLISTRARDPRI